MNGGVKKSALLEMLPHLVFLEIKPDLIIQEIGLKVDFGESATDECWLFTRGFFDGELLFDREFRVSDE